MAIGSFLRKLAGPLAGAATSAIPGVGPLLAGPVAGAVGGLANRGGGGGGSSALPPMNEEEAKRRTRIAGGLEGLQTTSTDASGRFLGGAEQDLGGARGFYGKLAGGDPAAVASAFAPQLNQTRRQFQTGIDQAEQFAPRGGGRTAALAGGRIARAGAISSILGQAPYLGAKGLQETAQTGGQLGVNTGQLAIGAGQGAANVGLAGENLALDRAQLGQGQQRIDLTKRQQDIGLYGDLGKNAADVIPTVVDWFKNRKQGASPSGGGSAPSSSPLSYGQPQRYDPNTPTPPALSTIAPPPPVIPPNVQPGPITAQYATGYKAAQKKQASPNFSSLAA